MSDRHALLAAVCDEPTADAPRLVFADWLDDHGVPNAYEMAEVFVEYGITTDDLDCVNQEASDKYLLLMLKWICNVLNTEKMVGEISEASQRIGRLINAIKEYSHMDGGANKKKISLREGIQSTLTILQHKLKSKHIEVKLDIPEELPKIMLNPGEINQVWTNVIDNAIDAMPDKGVLQIKAERKHEFLLTHIIDNGGGIAPEIMDLIFDPFFTTKEVGKGTGLGLEIVQTIVKQHNGKIQVKSQPGHTEFTICLPID